jgi:hypothetical protein
MCANFCAGRYVAAQRFALYCEFGVPGLEDGGRQLACFELVADVGLARVDVSLRGGYRGRGGRLGVLLFVQLFHRQVGRSIESFGTQAIQLNFS